MRGGQGKIRHFSGEHEEVIRTYDGKMMENYDSPRNVERTMVYSDSQTQSLTPTFNPKTPTASAKTPAPSESPSLADDLASEGTPM